MPRFKRPEFRIGDLQQQPSDAARSRLLFDWWCDDADRASYLRSLNGQVAWIDGRALVENDPAPPRHPPPEQGHAKVALLSDPRHVAQALSDAGTFSNVPYAELGGAGFMLALDPGASTAGGTDWHAEQRRVAQQLLDYPPDALAIAAGHATRQAAVLSLAASTFDLAEFAEQAALRYFGLVFGYAGADHGLLEDAARSGYRALQYLIVGRHFVSEPGTIPAAQQALARLGTRTSALADDHANLQRAPRLPHRPGPMPPDACWPAGVQPWHELQLGALGEPVLRRLLGAGGRLSGQDLCNLVGGLLVGTVGNVQSSLCFILQAILAAPDGLARLREQDPGWALSALPRLLAQTPPVPYLPRRTLREVRLGTTTLPADTDCILVLPAGAHDGCPWGNTADGKAIHHCVGMAFIQPLLAALLEHVVALPDLDEQLDPRDGEAIAPRRLWGMGCSSYPLRYRRDRARVQQPLIVVMPIKTPIAENAARLRRVIRNAAPRIEHLLQTSRMVHVAWFEFMDNDSQLALRTVYDGDFDSYIQYFALEAGELFDQLFACIEGGPPLPVAEHPNAFVETIRRYNRTPLGGYFYCAYPSQPVSQIPGGRT